MKKITTIVNYILDESGSMQDIKQSVIDGFNEYIGGLKNQKGKVLFTLTKFDSTGIRTPYLLTPIKDVKPLNAHTYKPGAWTPLYDAVVETVEKISEGVKENQASLVIIMTDGAENASKKHTAQCVKDLIHKLEHKGNWTFVFLGANQDSWATGQTLGIQVGNIANWKATADGTRGVMRGLSQDTAFYAMSMEENSSKGIAMNASNFVQKTGEDNHE